MLVASLKSSRCRSDPRGLIAVMLRVRLQTTRYIRLTAPRDGRCKDFPLAQTVKSILDSKVSIGIKIETSTILRRTNNTVATTDLHKIDPERLVIC